MQHKQKHTRQLARIVTRPYLQCRHCGGGPNAPSATSAPSAQNAPSAPNAPSTTHAPRAQAPIRSNSGSRVQRVLHSAKACSRCRTQQKVPTNSTSSSSRCSKNKTLRTRSCRNSAGQCPRTSRTSPLTFKPCVQRLGSPR